MFGPGPAFAQLVGDQGFHADGDKGELRVIMRAVQVCVGRYFWIGVALAEEEELHFRLRDDLAPEAEVESAGHATEDGNDVLFPELYIHFSAMLRRWLSGVTSW